jgi:hypothetical protein
MWHGIPSGDIFNIMNINNPKELFYHDLRMILRRNYLIWVKNMRNLVWFEKKPADGYDLCSERMIAK